MDNAKKIIDKIKSDNIQPIPRWKFMLKRSLVWLVFCLAVLFGALAFSVVLFSVQQTDFDLIAHMSHSRKELILGLMPFFWIISLILFLVLAIYSVQYTERGYKFTVLRLVGFSAALSMLIGTLFFISGGASRLENTFATRLELYEGLQEKKVKIWMNPEDGLLAGFIQEVSENDLLLEDFDGNQWQVSIENIFIPGAVLMEAGEKIKLIGTKVDDDVFDAEEIRPWGGPGHRKGRRNF